MAVAPSIFWGSNVNQVVFLEVIPLVIHSSVDTSVEEQGPHDLTNFGVKKFLEELTRRSYLNLHDDSSSIEQRVLVEWVEPGSTSTRANGDPNFPKVVTSDDRRNGLSTGYLFISGRSDQNNLQRALFVSDHDEPQKSHFPIFFIPSNNPTILSSQPCALKVYARQPLSDSASPPTGHDNDIGCNEVLVTKATLTRILPPRLVYALGPSNTTMGLTGLEGHGFTVKQPKWWVQQQFLEHLSGERGDDFLPKELYDELLRPAGGSQNPETIQELTLRLSMQISYSIQIGTTSDALSNQAAAEERRNGMEMAIRRYLSVDPAALERVKMKNKQTETNLSPRAPQSRMKLSWEPSLLLHSPNHADGKTLLIQAIAQKIGCTKIHLIRPGQLMAKYGIHADSALESLLHGFLVSAATQDQRICIILDDLDGMMPPRMCGKSGAGDAAVPVFNAVASYLRRITGSLKERQEFPFPLKNPLYNLSGSGGRVLSVHCCLVGIVTCPDDGWRSVQKQRAVGGGMGQASNILDAMVGSRYRLPALSAQTRIAAISNAIKCTCPSLNLDEMAKKRLPFLAASAAWAKGSCFLRLAQTLQKIGTLNENEKNRTDISIEDLERAFASVKSHSGDFADVAFPSQQQYELSNEDDDIFASVGGNVEAKLSLEDALALDPIKRQMLTRFGMSPPSGVLLYGPPGCGKTLLAKAVARLLKGQNRGTENSDFGRLDHLQGPSLPSLGGTFISLGSSDLVRAEIGTSEKMLVSAFEFADQNAPSVLFLDEFQALFTERSRGGSGKLASTLLQCLDDVKRWQNTDDSIVAPAPVAHSTSDNRRVVVMGATNTPWMVDSAFLRPGRFDRVVHVGLPTVDERESILRLHVGRMKIAGGNVTSSEMCRLVAERTEGFSGADLAALCRAAAIRALMESGAKADVMDTHFLLAIEEDVSASSDDNLVKRIRQWKP